MIVLVLRRTPYREYALIYEMGAEYFFNQDISVGLDYSINRGDDLSDEGNAITPSLTAFLTQQISGAITYVDFSADNSNGTDFDLWLFELDFRI